MTVSTLRRLLAAMGGELELVARFPDRTIQISQFDEEVKKGKANVACEHRCEQLRESAPVASEPSPRASLQSVLESWLSGISTLGVDGVRQLKLADDGPQNGTLCEIQRRTIFLDTNLAAAFAARASADVGEVCKRLLSHEVGHWLSRGFGTAKAELAADEFAGWVDGRYAIEPSLGASIFYELGCPTNDCTHPSRQARLRAYLVGHRRGGKATLPDGHAYSLVSCAQAETTAALSYFVLRTDRLPTMRHFYATLGFSPQEEKHGIGPKHLACELSNAVLEFYPETASSDRVRLGFTVPSLNCLVDSLRNAGLADRVIRTSAESVLLRDPAGNHVEIAERQPVGSVVCGTWQGKHKVSRSIDPSDTSSHSTSSSSSGCAPAAASRTGW